MPKFFAGLAAGAMVLYAGTAFASRNSSGTYSLYTPGNPVVTATTISSGWANNTLSDISTELTDSLSRSGKGGMLADLRGIDGTVAAPAFSWTSEPGTGWYRIGAGNPGLSVLGSKRYECTSTGCVVTGTLGVSGGSTFNTGGTKLYTDGSTIAGFSALWAGTAAAAPSTTNYNVAMGDTATSINNPTLINLAIGATVKASLASSGLTIGASGTPISARYRATVLGGTMSGLGPLGAVSSASTTVTVTGATTAGDCTLHFLASTNAVLTAYCYVSSANTVTIQVGNPTAGVQAISATTVSVVVEQP